MIFHSHLTVEPMTLSLLHEPEFTNVPEIMPVTGCSFSEIFEIEFCYHGDIFRAKALKISYHNQQTIYKVTLGSSLSSTLNICWLQRQPQGWVVLLGQGLEEQLKSAITAAIEWRKY